MEQDEHPLDDPARETEWEVWYLDTFDRECPPSVDVRGRGLVRGLIELWARAESAASPSRSTFPLALDVS